jgi:hypothetical protein
MRIKTALLACLIISGGLIAQDSPVEQQSELPLGTWQYGVFMGKNRIGSAYITLKFEKGFYESTFEMTLRMSDPIVTTKETTRETRNFFPVSFSSSNVVVLKDRVTRDLVSATFLRNTVKLKRSGEEREVTIEGDFHVSGNFLTAQLLRAKYAAGFEAKGLIYDPTIEEEKAVPVAEKVIGKEIVVLPSGKCELIHTIQTIGPVRNIHNYSDGSGVSYKTTIAMLNTEIDLVLERKPGEKK